MKEFREAVAWLERYYDAIFCIKVDKETWTEDEWHDGELVEVEMTYSTTRYFRYAQRADHMTRTGQRGSGHPGLMFCLKSDNENHGCDYQEQHQFCTCHPFPMFPLSLGPPTPVQLRRFVERNVRPGTDPEVWAQHREWFVQRAEKVNPDGLW